MLGTVKKIINDNGRSFGFIHPADGSRDCFFHAVEVLPALEFGEHLRELTVEFELTDEVKGPRARNVRAAR